MDIKEFSYAHADLNRRHNVPQPTGKYSFTSGNAYRVSLSLQMEEGPSRFLNPWVYVGLVSDYQLLLISPKHHHSSCSHWIRQSSCKLLLGANTVTVNLHIDFSRADSTDVNAVSKGTCTFEVVPEDEHAYVISHCIERRGIVPPVRLMVLAEGQIRYRCLATTESVEKVDWKTFLSVARAAQLLSFIDLHIDFSRADSTDVNVVNKGMCTEVVPEDEHAYVISHCIERRGIVSPVRLMVLAEGQIRYRCLAAIESVEKIVWKKSFCLMHMMLNCLFYRFSLLQTRVRINFAITLFYEKPPVDSTRTSGFFKVRPRNKRLAQRVPQRSLAPKWQ